MSGQMNLPRGEDLSKPSSDAMRSYAVLWRRRLRISVRGLIVLVLAIGSGMGWIVRQAHVQSGAVSAIRVAGGVVQYECERRDGSDPGIRPGLPRWLVELIGYDYFDHVAGVWLPQPTGPTLRYVGRFQHLEELTIWAPGVGDAGLAHLAGLTELTELDLTGTQFTDLGLVHLKGLTKLKVLNLQGNKVTGTGLAHLECLTGLKSLNLDPSCHETPVSRPPSAAAWGSAA